MEGHTQGVRRAVPVLVGLVLVAAGLFGLMQLFTGRDDADITAGASQGPGALEEQPGDPPTSGAVEPAPIGREGEVPDELLVYALSLGNVALVYGSRQPPPELVQMRDDATGPFDPELAAAGQMALLVRRPGSEGIQALAWMRRLQVADPADAQLRDFVDAWLGKGRGNTE